MVQISFFHINTALGGKILSRIMERNVLTVDHAILDAAPLLPLPNWLVNPLRHYQAINVWTCYHWTGFWKAVFRSHYFDILLDECKKTWPWGGRQAVLDGYKSVYTNKLESISGNDIHFWYGTKEAFVAKPQVEHLLKLCPSAHVEVFAGMNHGQLKTLPVCTRGSIRWHEPRPTSDRSSGRDNPTNHSNNI